VIGIPVNDLTCLGSITELVADLAAKKEPWLLELAAAHETTSSLATWIRSLPQRDDDGTPEDGPKVDDCDPPQRVRIPAEDPNCVERAALFLATAEVIDPNPVRQLATIDTPIGLHTFPVESGAPVILDPRVPHDCAHIALSLAKDGPVTVDTREAIEWTARLAEAGAAPQRNGPGRVRRARNAVLELVDRGVAPVDGVTTETIGWMLAMAEHVARQYGSRALSVVRTTASAIAELADEAITRARPTPRNFALEGRWHALRGPGVAVRPRTNRRARGSRRGDARSEVEARSARHRCRPDRSRRGRAEHEGLSLGHATPTKH